MANPNIVSVSTIYGCTTYYMPTDTSEVILLPNASSSDKVYKINDIIVCNIDGTNAVNASVFIYTDGSVAQGSAPSGGTAYALASTVSVPANAVVNVVEKVSALYLQENTSISIQSSAGNKLVFTVSYEDIS